MIKQFRYWITFVEAPAEIQARIKKMAATFGYKTPRINEAGRPVVSLMFLMHVKAVTVSFIPSH